MLIILYITSLRVGAICVCHVDTIGFVCPFMLLKYILKQLVDWRLRFIFNSRQGVVELNAW